MTQEQYDATMAIKARINEITGSGPAQENLPTSSAPTATPTLPDLPVGVPPAQRNPAQRTDQQDGVPMDVMAVGDPLRDAQQRVAPYVPPTTPSSGSNPFPQLGLKGRPLG